MTLSMAVGTGRLMVSSVFLPNFLVHGLRLRPRQNSHGRCSAKNTHFSLSKVRKIVHTLLLRRLHASHRNLPFLPHLLFPLFTGFLFTRVLPMINQKFLGT